MPQFSIEWGILKMTSRSPTLKTPAHAANLIDAITDVFIFEDRMPLFGADHSRKHFCRILNAYNIFHY